jgi:hypothetical protein
MNNEQIIKEKGNQKCIFYNDDICRKGDKTRDCLNCARVEYHSLYKLNWENQERLESQLKVKEEEIKALNKIAKQHLAETFEMQKEILELKQTLKEVKELAEAITNGTHFSNNIEAHLKEMVNKILEKINEVEDE